MGCYICKQLRADYYEEEAGDCWVCMSINILIASALAAGAWLAGLPAVAATAAWGVMLFRIGHVGYLFPNTPKWLPYIDFLLEPLGTVPDEAEVLEPFAEDVVEICNAEYDDEAAQNECVHDLTDIIALRYREELDEAEFYAALGTALGLSASEMKERVENDRLTHGD